MLSNTNFCGFINVFIVPYHCIIKVKHWNFENYKPTHSRVYNSHAGETNIILHGSDEWMILSYIIDIWTYQVYMNLIPWFQSCYILGQNKSINSLSIFELLKYLARLRINIRFNDKAFTVSYYQDYFHKSTSNRVVQIEMVPIQHTSVQSLWYVYIYTISD